MSVSMSSKRGWKYCDEQGFEFGNLAKYRT